MRCRRRLWDSAALPGPPSHAALSLRRRRRLWDSGRTRLAGRAGSGARIGRASVALPVGPLEPLRGEEVALRAGGGRRAGGAGESRLGGLDLDGGSRPAFGPASQGRLPWSACRCWHSGRCGGGYGTRAHHVAAGTVVGAAPGVDAERPAPFGGSWRGPLRCLHGTRRVGATGSSRCSCRLKQVSLSRRAGTRGLEGVQGTP
jgi:hypothetical protein